MSCRDLAEQLADLSSRGPRYTSYPPATELGAITSERVEAELARLAAARSPLSLYLHVPFCRSLCWYCGCNVIPTRDESRGLGYVDDLATEMAALARRIGDAPITEIALGGGSPNFLAPRTMRVLFDALERYFEIAPDARRSIELDPRQTTSGQIETLATAGFRAMSMGVQDFDDRVQDAIHRHQSAVQTRWLVDRARVAGFTDVNVDVVYGLPRQTEESFAATLDTVISLEPDRVALFGYAHLPSKLPHQQLVERAGRVLDPYERATLLLLAIDRFEAAGYVHLGLDHFAKPGSRLARAAAERRMVRNFQGYTEHVADAVIGLGVSAISTTPRMIWQNHAQLPPWQDAIANTALPVARGFELDDDDRLRGAVIERLMCDGTVDLARLGREHGVDPDVYFRRELARMTEVVALATYEPATHSIHTTPLGKLLVRNVCMLFDRYHKDDSSRHSPTI